MFTGRRAKFDNGAKELGVKCLVRKGKNWYHCFLMTIISDVCWQIFHKHKLFLELPYRYVDHAPALAAIITLLLLCEDKLALPFRKLLKKPLQRYYWTNNEAKHMHSDDNLTHCQWWSCRCTTRTKVLFIVHLDPRARNIGDSTANNINLFIWEQSVDLFKNKRHTHTTYRWVVRTKTSRPRPGPLHARNHSCGGGFSTRSPSMVKNKSTLQGGSSTAIAINSEKAVLGGHRYTMNERIHKFRIRTLCINQPESDWT